MARFERFVALRYLWGAEGRSEGRSFLRFITYVAVGGIAVGVAALLLALSVVRGFSQEIRSKIMGIGADVEVAHYIQNEPLTRAPERESQLKALPAVARVRPVVETFVLLRKSSTAVDGVIVLGVEAPPPYLTQRIVRGRFATDTATGAPGLVVGASLAERLGLRVGRSVTAFALPRNVAAGTMGRPRVKQFQVTGIYETSLTTIDDTYTFTSLPAARDLARLPATAVSRFDLELTDPMQADSVAARIERDLGFPIAARTVFERFSGLFAWVNLQEGIIPLVIGVIVIVAAFNIVGTLLMMMLEKTREIGVLQSLGASARMVRRLFLSLGLLMGGVGTALGALIALGLGLAQKHFQLIPLPAEAYYMTTAPIELNPWDFVIVAVVACTLCALAAYVPARVASRIEPVRAIRFR